MNIYEYMIVCVCHRENMLPISSSSLCKPSQANMIWYFHGCFKWGETKIQ